MLKKVNRLAKDKDIQNTFARGRTFSNPFFNIKFAPCRQSQPRFTVVVSTKVFKRAVARNRLKRIIREYLRKNLGHFKSGNYAIMAKPRLASAAENEVLKSFLDLCSKLR